MWSGFEKAKASPLVSKLLISAGFLVLTAFNLAVNPDLVPRLFADTPSLQCTGTVPTCASDEVPVCCPDPNGGPNFYKCAGPSDAGTVCDCTVVNPVLLNLDSGLTQ